MELHDFVRRTIEEVVSGVKAANEVVLKNGGSIQDTQTSVAFDVAVTTTTTGESKAGAGIFVAAIGLGAQGTKGTTDSLVSRIQFSVPIRFPGEHRKLGAG